MSTAEDLLKALLQAQQMGQHAPPKSPNQQQRNQEIILNFDKGYASAQKSQNQFQVNFGGTGTVPNMLPPLSKSKYSMEIAVLKEITLKDLELKRNEGYYFRSVVVKKPWKMPGPTCGINVLLKDKNGDLARGNFYGVTKSENWDDLEKIFSAGREIIVLHPFYKVAMDGQYSIRIENRYEFYFADETVKTEDHFGSLIDKSKVLKDEGNQELKTKPKSALQKYIKSIMVLIKEVPMFTEEKEDFTLEWRVALKEHEKKQALEHLAVVFSNCSLVFTGDKKSLSALYYAKFSLWSNPKFFKANLRIVRALIDLLRLHEAENLLKNIKDSQEAVQFQSEIMSFLDETLQKIKEYSSPKIVIDFLTENLPLDDETSYIGPIELYEDSEKGRGYKAMRDICRGETLLIEKGFVYKTHNPEFTYELLNKLDRKQNLKAMYMHLFPTKKYPLTKYLTGTPKGPLTESIRETLFSMLRATRPKQWENFTEMEVKELLSKTSFNTFAASGGTGLFPHCSFFNHSCDPNTMMKHKKDMVMVIALNDIKKGQEICVPYVPLADPTFKRRAQLLEGYGFECNCERCREVEEWKQKEAEIMGLTCPQCNTEVKCQDDEKFVCPNGCWTSAYKNYEELSAEVIMTLVTLKNSSDEKEQIKLIDQLKRFEKLFSSANIHQVFIWSGLATFHTKRKEEDEFQKYFQHIVDVVKRFPDPQLPIMIANHLVEIVICFQRDPTKQEFEALTYFGLRLDIISALWKKAPKLADFLAHFEADRTYSG